MFGTSWHFLATTTVFVESFRQQMRDAGFLQLLSDLRNHSDATVSSVAAAVSLGGDVG